MARRRALGWVGFLVASALCVLWLVVVPDKASTTDGLQALAIRYGHPLSWAGLAALGLLVAVDAPARTRNIAAAVALGGYLAFLAALLLF